MRRAAPTRGERAARGGVLSSGVKKAVFLDRDDTIIENREATAGTATPGDLFDPALVRLLPGAAEGLGRLHGAGFLLVVVTNQGALAQGRCTLRQVEATNDRLRELLAAEGVELAGVYLAPARPSGDSARFNHDPEGWRKPGGGMVRAAAAELGLDLAASWMVGDAERDVEAGVAGGIACERCLRVGTGAIPGLAEAARRIVEG